MDQFTEFVNQIDTILHEARNKGVDYEEVLARVYAKHLESDEACDCCHMYGITFAEKLNRLMLHEPRNED